MKTSLRRGYGYWSCAGLVGGAMMLGGLGGCRAYEEKPLDDAAHRAAWLSRTPEAEGIGELARRLDGAEAPGAFDLSDGLGLREAEAVALVFNAELRAARLRAEVARVGAENAGLWDDPEIGIDVEKILSSVDNPWIVAGSLGLTLPVSGRLGAEKKEADAERAAALAKVAAAEWDVRVSVRREWAEWSAAVMRLAEAEEFVLRLEGVVGAAERLEGAGEMARTESRLFRLERVTRQNDMRRMRVEVQELELSLRAVMGLAPDAPLRLTPGWAPVVKEDGDLRAAMEARSPALAELRAEYEVAEKRFAHEVRKQYPDITIGPGGKSEDGDERVLLGVSMPLPLWNQNKRGVAEAEMEREVARAEYEGALERLHAELARSLTRLEGRRAELDELQAVVAPLIEEQRQEVKRLAELGEFDAIVTLETLVREHEAKVRLIETKLAEIQAAVEVGALVGPRKATMETEVVR